MAFILGPMLEAAFRQSLIMSDGKFSIFMTRPISAVALADLSPALHLLRILLLSQSQIGCTE